MTSALDRLLHHSTVITIGGDSYRLREMRQRKINHGGQFLMAQKGSILRVA
ncbi:MULTISPECIES: ATP-binding protein [unclassified Rhizobium]|uniref:ATP-binding protein n=1 Tax=unclassified Rhizobium TaxID=2613769 RepID=UPI0035A0DBAD